jgi:hypothetical protein
MVDYIANIPMAVIVAAVVGLLRSIGGWLENAWKDGIINEFEYKQLAGTIIKYVASIMLLMLGVDNTLPILGVDQATASAAAVPVSASIAYVLDVVTSALKTKATTNVGQ